MGLSLLSPGEISFGDYRYHHYEKRDILKNTANTTFAFVSPHEIIKSGKAPMQCSPAY
jgi:hypothetical protein